MIKLGVNVDHIATVREARKEGDPDLLRAVREVAKSGADGITAHLREDRRHIQDGDLYNIKKEISLPLNMEMCISDEIVGIALDLKPEKACLVPEKRQELTTEGGLNVSADVENIKKVVGKLKKAGVCVSLFIDADKKQIEASQKTGANFIELHTGPYAHAFRNGEAKAELEKLKHACELAHKLKLGVNAGHGLNYMNVKDIMKLPYLEELNIGHSIVAHAIFVGVGKAVWEMKALLADSALTCPFGR